MSIGKKVIVVFFSIFLIFVGICIGMFWGAEQNDVKTNPISASREIQEIPELPSSTPSLPEFIATSNSRFSMDEQENISIYDTYNKGVVNITTETIAYNWFFEPVPQDGESGSGSIIDVQGHVLTNHHVIENANKIFITLADGTRYEGDIVGVDTENDLAVLSFNPKGKVLITIPLGESSNLKVGQKVLAIGNPFALERTLTTGIISGVGRPVRTRNKLIIRNMIQTDASINMGNSGGPLLDSNGRVIGVNTIIYSLSGGSLGIGFAIPIDTAKRVIPDLIQYGKVRRGWIDIIPRQLFPELVQYDRLPVSQGILISQIEPGGNALAAGLRGGKKNKAVRYGNTIVYLGGDIIVEIDGMDVFGIANLYEALEDNKPGDVVKVIYIRGKRKLETEVTLSERPENFQWD